jgi:hypothetical protein
MLGWTVKVAPNKRSPGTPNPVSDARGGPGTFRGVGFQVQVGAVRLLTELHRVWRDPLLQRHVRFELRELVPPEGHGPATEQFGYDVGSQTAGVITSAEEVKSAPGAKDVNEFVARLPNLPATLDGAELVLVTGAATAAVRGLESLLVHAGECSTPEQFEALVESLGDPAEKALLALAGGQQAHAVLRRAKVSSEPVPVLVTQHDTLVAALVGADKIRELSDEIVGIVQQASKTRESVPVGALAERLIKDGVLLPPPAVDVGHDDSPLLAAFVALEACPVPLPASILAAALDLADAGQALATVEPAITGEKIVRVGEDLLWRPPPVNRMPVQGHEIVLHRLLERLVAYAGEVPDGVAAGQTPNVLAVARVAAAHDLDLVARAFTAYDKPGKTYGDLSVIYDLALVGRAAARAAAQRGGEGTNALLDHVSRASICGVSWVLQRVGEHEAASVELAEARAIAERTGDAKSVAFADKCHGRIERLRAEALKRRLGPDHPDVASALDSSVELLTRARTGFGELVQKGQADPKDAAECLSLLARTHAVAERYDLARELAAEAALVLTMPPSKEWADLRLLTAELDLRNAETSVDDPQATGSLAERLQGASAAVSEVLDAFPVPAEVPWARSGSEITARAMLLAGRVLTASGDASGALERFERSQELYAALGDDRAAGHAAYESLMTAPGRVPQGLLVAAEDAGADDVVVVRALRRHEGKGIASTDDAGYWQGAVETMETEIRASRTPWAERRRTA